MTKRKGRRPNRNGSQRHPPGATSRLPTIQRDDLPSKESLQLELRALNEGWTVDDPAFNAYRSALIKKVAMIGLSNETQGRVAVQALRAVALVELREKQLKLQSIGLQLRAMGASGELPQQITNNLQVNIESPATPAPPQPFEVIQKLIARKDVRAAIDRRPDIAVELSDQSDRRADQESSAP